MPYFGSYSLLLALVFSVYAFGAGVLALVFKDDRLGETARRAGIAIFVAVTAASACLVYAAFTNDFSVAYILQHSNRALPAPYKFAALWSGHLGEAQVAIESCRAATYRPFHRPGTGLATVHLLASARYISSHGVTFEFGRQQTQTK